MPVATSKQRKKIAPLPRITSKTITVAALLKKIQRLILAEPKRLNMDAWISAFKGTSVRGNSVPMPACGTVACMAGWGATLLRPDDASGKKLDCRAGDVMSELLGFDEDDYSEGFRTVGGLFEPFGAEEFNEPLYLLPPVGTVKHARMVARRINEYMKAHPEILNRKIDVAAARKALAARGPRRPCAGDSEAKP